VALAPSLVVRHDAESELADSNTKSCVFFFPLCSYLSVAVRLATWVPALSISMQNLLWGAMGTDIFISSSLMAESLLFLLKAGDFHT
jgi:hypothetical protein